jgi:hypothetical protein
MMMYMSFFGGNNYFLVSKFESDLCTQLFHICTQLFHMCTQLFRMCTQLFHMFMLLFYMFCVVILHVSLVRSIVHVILHVF